MRNIVDPRSTVEERRKIGEIISCRSEKLIIIPYTKAKIGDKVIFANTRILGNKAEKVIKGIVELLTNGVDVEIWSIGECFNSNRSCEIEYMQKVSKLINSDIAQQRKKQAEEKGSKLGRKRVSLEDKIEEIKTLLGLGIPKIKIAKMIDTSPYLLLQCIRENKLKPKAITNEQLSQISEKIMEDK